MSVDAHAVSLLLQQSRDAHDEYRMNVSRTAPAGSGTIAVSGNPDTARAALQRAYDRRLAATTLDPQHTASAWRGEPITHDHDALMEFYVQQLAR
jgi:hypothetical protein